MLIEMLTGPLAAFLLAMKPSEANGGEDDLLKKFKENPGEYNKGVQNQSFHPRTPSNNGGSAMPIAVHVTNGRDLARGTASYMGHQADLPNAGPNRFDGRMGRAFPSNTVAA